MENNSRMNFSLSRMIVMLIMLAVVVVGGTFAWFTFSSRQSALVLTVGDINDTQIKLSPYQIKGEMTPVNTYTSGVYSEVEVTNGDRTTSVVLYYKINDLDVALIDNGLAYTIIDTSDGSTVKTGYFSDLIDTSEDLPESVVILDENTVVDTTSHYKVYLWLDSTKGDQSEVQGSTLDVELNGSIGSVTISGTNTYGQVLTANVVDTNTEATYTYQWFANDSNSMSGGTAISEATTSNKYTVGSGLAGKYIYVVANAIEDYYDDRVYTDITDSENNGSATVNKSSATLKVSPTTINLTYPTADSSTLSYTYTGDGTVSCTVADTSVASCSVNTSTKKVTVTPLKAAYTTTLTLSATAGTDYNATTSNNVSVNVAKGTMTAGVVTISGTNTYNSTLTATVSTDTSPKADSYSYQWWYATSASATSGTNISGATSSTYTIGDNLVGKYIGVTVTAKKANYNDVSFSDNSDSAVISTTPTISLSSKTATYTGSPIAANTVTTNSNGTISYVYYTNSSCSTQTTTSNGATVNGGAPADVLLDSSNNVISYYVKATVAATANYSAASTGCVQHKINKKSIAVSWGSTTTFTYSGSEQAPTASVTTGISAETMTLSRTTGVNAGNYTSTASCSSVTGGRAKCSNYTLTGNTKAFTITAKNASNFTITLSPTSYTYDGTAKTPSVTVKDGNTTLTSGTHYTTAYSNNTNVGTATVTVIGTGNYTGTKTATFTISKASCSCTISSVTAPEYPENVSSGKVIYNCTGDGDIGVVSETTDIITVGTIGTSDAALTAKNIGSSKITVSQAAGTNYNVCTNDSETVTVTPSTYTVKYSCGEGNGTPPTTQTIKYGNTITIESDAGGCSKDGYVFSTWNDPTGDHGWTGWTGTWKYKNGTTYGITNNVLTLTASYAPIYTISYNANGGTGTMESHTVKSGDSIKIKDNTFTRTGYTFAGWTTNSDGTADGYGWSTSTNAGWSGTWSYTNGEYGIANNKLQLYARWTANSYKIAYTLNGGTAGSSAPTTATYDSTVTISNPTRSGYTFVGWTSTTIDTTTAYYGSNAWSSTSTKVTASYFRNLTATSGGTVTMTANWEDNVAPTTPTLTTIYDIWGSENYTISNGYEKDHGVDGTWTTITNDPYIMFDNLGHINGIKGVYIEFEEALDKNITIQSFYATSTTSYSGDYHTDKTLAAGETKLIILFDDEGDWTKVRFDIGTVSNLSYKIKSLGVLADANQWNDDNKYIQGVTTETGSGVDYWQYTYSSSASTTGTDDTTSWVTYSNSDSATFVTHEFTAERNQLVYIRACDKVGNCSDKASTYIKIDKGTPSTPTIMTMYDLWDSRSYTYSNYKADAGVDGTWTTSSGDPTISINGVTEITNVTGAYVKLGTALTTDMYIQVFYAEAGGSLNETNSTGQIKMEAGQTELYLPFRTTGEWVNYRFDLGNDSGVSFKIEHLALVADANQWNRDDINLRLSSSDSGGISYYQYTYSSTASTTGTDHNSTWVTYSNSNSSNYITNDFTAERNQLVYLRACDASGKCSDKASTYIKIDKTEPTISDIYSTNNIFPTRTINSTNQVTVSENNITTSGGDPYIVYSGLTANNVSKVIATFNTAVSKNFTLQIFYALTGTSFSETNSVKVDVSAGDTVVEATLPGGFYTALRFDLGGESNVTYNIARIDLAGEGISNSSYVYAGLSDSGSKVSSYVLSTSSSTPSSFTDVSDTNSYSLVSSANPGNYYLYAKDVAGNVSSSKVIVTDGVISNMVTLSPPSYVYDGNTKTPSITVKDGSTTLTGVQNMMVCSVSSYASYDNFKLIFDSSSANDNTASQSIKIQRYLDSTYVTQDFNVKATGLYNYVFTKDSTFNKLKIAMNGNKADAQGFIDLSSLTNGTSYTLSFVIEKYGTYYAEIVGLALYPTNTSAKYVYAYEDNVNMGTGKVLIYGINGYTGYVIKPFVIGYTVALNNQSATSAGTGTLYGYYGNGIYLDSSYTKKMTTSANKITIPTKTSYVFGGYYTGTDGTGTQMIDANGYITSNFTNTYYNASATLYAKWTLETTKPTYTSYEIKNITTSGYDVYVYGVSDNVGIDRVQFPTWTAYNNQDDIQSSWTTNSVATGTNQGSGTWYYRVNTTDHNGEAGTYNTHVYIYDVNGNQTSLGIPAVTVPGITVTIGVNNSTYGSVSAISVSVGYGAKYTSSGATLTFPGGQTVTATAKSVTGYNTSFSSWSSTSGTITAAITINANFTSSIKTYTVAYNANGGSGAPSSQTKTYDVNLTLSSTKPTRTGYTFQGWGTSSTATTTSYQPGGTYTSNSSITLYAIWKAHTYTVSYDANGGSGAPSSQTKTHDVNLTLSNTIPTKTGYAFQGWGTSSTATTVSYAAGGTYTSNSSVTLYAIWKIKTYTVSYNANGGSGAPSSQTKTHGVDLTLSSTKPTRTNYTFLGWSTSSSSTTATYQPGGTYTSNSSITLYAVWGTAFQVYSADDNSLRLYVGAIPSTGNTYNGLTVTYVTSSLRTLGGDYIESITQVIVEDSIVVSKLAISTTYINNWFADMVNLTKLDLTKLDVSNVIDMSGIFKNAGSNSTSFEIIGLDAWDVSGVTNMSSMFSGTCKNSTTCEFNGIESWDVSNVTNMNSMFQNAGYNSTNFVYDLSNWDVSSVTDVGYMFASTGYSSTNFTLNLSGWNMADTDGQFMFQNTGCKAVDFTLNLSDWNFSSLAANSYWFDGTSYLAENVNLNFSGWTITDDAMTGLLFSSIGSGATNFKIDLSNWDISAITDINFLGKGGSAQTFEMNLTGWDVSHITDMSGVFDSLCKSVTTCKLIGIENWDVSNVTDMSTMFKAAGISDTLNLSNWDVSSVTTMDSMFFQFGLNMSNVSLNLSNWDVSSVTDVLGMFYQLGQNASNVSLNLNNWNLLKITDMSEMRFFESTGENASTISIDLTNWDVSSITNMSSMFENICYSTEICELTGIGNWDVSNVTDMSYMFSSVGYKSTNFTLDLSSWDVSGVTNISAMFANAGYSAVNWTLTLDGWDVSDEVGISDMFSNVGDNAESINLNLSNWNLINITTLDSVFYGIGTSAGEFNLNLNGWDISSVTDVSYMFDSAGYSSTSFSLNMSDWNAPDTTIMDSMFDSICYNSTTCEIIGVNMNAPNVTDISSMLINTGYKVVNLNIDLSGWDTSSITDLGSAFSTVGNNSTNFTLNLSNWDVSNVLDFEDEFVGIGSAVSEFILNLSGWDVSKDNNLTSMFVEAGKNTSNFELNLSGWNLSNDVDMSFIFESVADNGGILSIDVSNWNVSNVTNMSGVFSCIGYGLENFQILGLNSWDTSSATEMTDMFSYSGENATTWNIGDISGWNLSNVTDMTYMFSAAGSSVEEFTLDLSGFNVSNVITINSMFLYVGYYSNSVNLVLSNWNASNVIDMSYMFSSVGHESNSVNLDLSNWNMSSVTDMSYMFSEAGFYAMDEFILDLSTWDVSSVTTMDSMFYKTGIFATTWNIGDISRWNTSNVTNMSSMFEDAGSYSETWSLDLSTKVVTNDDGTSYTAWNVDKVTSYYNFNLGVEEKIIAPAWVN